MFINPLDQILFLYLWEEHDRRGVGARRDM
jgi:hypothetical protein